MAEYSDYFDITEFEQELLDAYFHFRCNLPMKDPDTGLDYKQSFKTTQDIATELDDMGGVQVCSINAYLKSHDYQIATQPDGTLAWAIWERVITPTT